MRIGHGLSRHRFIAFVAVLVLALAVPGMAFAASFSNAKPAAGSSTTVTKPAISVVVYDRYQVYGTGSRYMYVDGKSVSFNYAAVAGWGWKKQKFTYTPATALTLGTHTVSIKVKNRRGTTYRYSWSFTVTDGVAPVTTFTSATNRLSASDNVGVAHTYYRLDGGAQVEGTVVNATVGSHLLEFWSVDAAGNEEMHKYALVVVAAPYVDPHSFPTDTANLACQAAGCHTPSKYRNNVARLHEETSRTCRCHQNDTSTPVTKSCVACHGTAPSGHSAATHVPIVSAVAASDPASCNFSGCHGANFVVTIHRGNCAICHDSSNATVKAVIAAGNATCESCHNQGSFDAIHGPLASPTSSVHVAPIPATCTATCHPTSAVASHTGFGTRRPGCSACHFRTDRAPSVVCADCHTSAGMAAAHAFTHTALQTRMGTSLTGKTCTACHGTDILSVGFVPGEHNGCSCHVYNEVSASVNGCADCHKDGTAPHGFTNGVTPWGTGYTAASGHNTTLFGTLGALTKWDGSEGVVIRDSEEDTITQDWPLPTSGVFWSQSKPLNLDGTVSTTGEYSLNPTDSPAVAMGNRGGTDMASKINTSVGWDSVITCEDCHTGLSTYEVAGPHGANVVSNWGLDPNFPDDWTKGEITSFDPTGMRSIETTMGSPNPFYAKLGSKVWPPEGSSGTTDKPNVWKNGVNVGIATISEGGFYDTTSTPSNGYSAGTVTGRFICQKCHKLTNSYQGLGIEGNGRGFRSNNFNYMGFSNEAHMEHHADMVTGQANCVSCHIAIPHGWKRPRLLVYESDPAPYKVQWVFPGYQTAAAKGLNADLSQGNWGFLGWNGLGSAPANLYKPIGGAIPNGTTGAGVNEIDPVAGVTVDNTGKTYSSHLEKIAATDTALKELAVGPGDNDNDGDDQPFADHDAFNGTSWGKWVQGAYGSEWLPDTSPNALYSNEAIQNNCNACTSAGLTHSDTGGTAEGVAETAVPGRTPVGGLGTWSRIPFWK